MISAIADTYTLRLSLYRDFTLTLNLPTRVPYLPNGGFSNAYISQTRYFEICEPFLLHAQPAPTPQQVTIGAEPEWYKVLRRVTLRFQYFTPHPTLPSYWRLAGHKWEKHITHDDTPAFPAADARTTATSFLARMTPHLNASLHAWNVRLTGQQEEEILTPAMLSSLQQAVSTAQLFEGEVARVQGGSEGGKWWIQGRDVAARCYRTACLDGEEVEWEDC
jgi:hypothetical protein